MPSTRFYSNHDYSCSARFRPKATFEVQKSSTARNTTAAAAAFDRQIDSIVAQPNRNETIIPATIHQTVQQRQTASSNPLHMLPIEPHLGAQCQAGTG